MPTKVWQNNFEKLKEFHQDHGHCLILKSDKEYRRVREWLHENFALYKKNKLDNRSFLLLDALDVDWKAFGKQWEKWEESYRKLSKHREKTGTANISQLVKGIGPWLSAQRVSYRENNLSDSKVILLESLSIDWNPSENNEVRWQEQFKKLEKYKETNGHCNVSRREDPDPGIWVSAQRTAYRLGRLGEERINKLESLGFEWSVR